MIARNYWLDWNFKLTWLTVCIVALCSNNVLAESTTITVKNSLPALKVCVDGNSLSVFSGSDQQVLVPRDKSHTFSGSYADLPGVGIQINNWYWTKTKRPVSTNENGAVQNPDNSGAQISVSADCVITQEVPPWFGKGIPTYEVAEISAMLDSSGACVVTVSENSYTDAVTPGCCSPPNIGNDTCLSTDWGKTDNGESWPPAN